MHPILFRIPLPKMPLKLWWGLAAIAAIALVYALLGLRRRDRAAAGFSILVAAGCGIAGYALRATSYEAPNLPIYSYGVMLGLSLVVGWYLTLTLAERDGLPKETMANCYVITALAAILGSRVLYVATNPDEFKQFSDFFALRRGGLVAYGGFLGGLLGSWVFLNRHKIRLLPWADVAVPSLASGLLITRIGCYLFGCDFGKRLPEGAPAFLKKLGTFPHWAAGTLEGGDGSPAYVKHLESFRGTPLGSEIMKTNASLPVHPTQIYESLVGLLLLVLLLWQRKHQKFRGQIFFLFAFAYGYLRFLLEILRDDTERGEFGPLIAEHWLISGSLLVMAIAFVFGISLGISNPKLRQVARALAFVPPVVAFIILKPPSFGKQITIQLSTSQWIGLLSAVAVSYFYAKMWETARTSPQLAMGLESLGDFKPDEDDRPRRRRDEDDDDDAHDDDEVAADGEGASKSKSKKKTKKKKKTLRTPGVSEERTPLPVDGAEAKAGDDADDEDADDEAEGAEDADRAEEAAAGDGDGETASADAPDHDTEVQAPVNQDDIETAEPPKVATDDEIAKKKGEPTESV
jgi:phosphatidylglycerol:prolipoprotein diacylglycerol transferase